VNAIRTMCSKIAVYEHKKRPQTPFLRFLGTFFVDLGTVP